MKIEQKKRKQRKEKIKRADEKERRIKGQIKSIYNFLSAIKNKTQYRNSGTAQT
jgi:CRISPR/Cas system-associated protein Cas7 (RAMP superfamily)